MSTELALNPSASPEPTSGPEASAAPHPLDPLSAEEIAAAAGLVCDAAAFGLSCRFYSIALLEPAKPATLALVDGAQPPRQALCVVWDRVRRRVYEARACLTTQRVLSFRHIPGRFTSYLAEDMLACEEAVRTDPRWQEAMRKRGVTDFSLAMIDPWPAGFLGEQDDPSTPGTRRVCRPLTFVRAAPGENGYARPVEGLIVTVDMDSLEVLDVADHGVVPIPPTAGNYTPALMFSESNRPSFPGLRDDVEPIEIAQPSGPSFTVDGWAVHWQKWDLRVGFNPREGLTLHQISYLDKGVRRPIVYRAALSEMVVPYGDSAPTHWNKNVFDMGEVGMGLMANSLTLGCDCLGHIHYFDGIVNNSAGEPMVIKNAICMHEEDVGISWKHTDFRTGEVEVRRSRRLVISTIATVGNYEYGFFWYLYTDGSIEFEVKLTGVLTTGALPQGVKPDFGKLVAPGLYGPNHQHFFNVRLDMTVDGPNNSVYEVNSIPEPPGPTNPHFNAWRAVPTLLTSEARAVRDVKQETARYWMVVNPSSINELGDPVAYKIMPGATAPAMVQEGSWIYDRARFVQHTLWVTAYEPRELYASGDYPYQSPVADGLPVYVAGDSSLVNTDLVVWYTVGAHHIVRPEDWPVMPVAYVGFHLKPVGFFDGNPALDMAPAKATHTHGETNGHPEACHCT